MYLNLKCEIKYLLLFFFLLLQNLILSLQSVFTRYEISKFYDF